MTELPLHGAGDAGAESASSAGAAGADEACAADAQAPLDCAGQWECDARPCGGYLWENGLVPVELDAGLPASQAELVRQALRAWSEGAAVGFISCGDEPCFVEGKGRWLSVRRGTEVQLSPSTEQGEQTLRLAPHTSLDRVIHELGHVLGLPDVWRRPDRDRYLRLSKSAFCGGDEHWNATVCSSAEPAGAAEPYRRTSGLLGPFEANSAMNMPGPEVCELEEPERNRVVPTAQDKSAVVELYRTLEGWSPFTSLGRAKNVIGALDYELAPNVTIAGPPALSTRGYPELELYARGSDNQLYWRSRSHDDPGAANLWQALGCCFDSDPAAVSWQWNRTDVFARDVAGNLGWQVLSDEGSPYFLHWGTWRDIGRPAAGIASAPTAVRTSNGQLMVFVLGGDQRLYLQQYDGAWRDGWERILDEAFVGVPAAAGRDYGYVELVAVGAGGALRWLTLLGSAVVGSHTLAGELREGTSPALAYSAGKVELFVQTPSRHLAQLTYDGTWGEWRDLGGVLSSSPAVTALRARPHLDVAALMDDQSRTGVWVRSWPYRRPCYVGAEACGVCAESCDGACRRGARLVGSPYVYRRAGTDDVVVSAAEDGHIYEFSRGSAWALTDLSLAAPSSALAADDPMAYVRSDGYSSVVYRAIDGGVDELFSLSPAWGSGALTEYAQLGYAKSKPFGYVRVNPARDAVVYVGPRNHVFELILSGSDWTGADLTELSAAPAAAGSPMPFVRGDQTNAVIFRDAAGHLNELYLSTSWQVDDMSEEAKAPPALNDAVPYVKIDGRNAVVYRSHDGHVYELSSAADGHEWELSDLTVQAGAPLASSDARVYRRGGQDAVVFSSGVGDLHELHGGLGGWKWQSVSDGAAAVHSVSTPTPYERSDGLPAIVYLADDHKLYELVRVGEQWERSIIYDPDVALGD